MAFFGLFKTREERNLESRLLFRQGQHRIQKFIQQMERSADEYWGLAKAAYQLKDQEQFQQMAAGYLNAQQARRRWECYLIKLKAIEMRRSEVEITTEFLRSMQSQTAAILRGATPEEMTHMQHDLEQALAKSEAQEEMLESVMELTGSQLEKAGPLDSNLLDHLTRTIAPGQAFSPEPPAAESALDREVAQAIRGLEFSK